MTNTVLSHLRFGLPLRWLIVAGAVLLLAATAAAQQATFDVVSIRRNASGNPPQSVSVTPTGVTFVNFPLRPIIQLAYGISQALRILGLPDWVNDRYDVITRLETPVSPATIVGMRPMLQAMLAERFKLSATLETREMPAYVLVVARPDRQLGPNLKRSTVVCAGRGAPAAAGDTGAAPVAQQPVPCGPREGGPGRFVFVGSQMSLFASVLSLSLGRTVIDRTGLTENYDLEVTYSPPNGPADANAPSLFTALQEQLGLRLDAERERVEVLVVDRLERPTEN